MAIPNLIKGKTAIVTGGAGEIGRAIVVTLAEAGADIAVSDIVVTGDEVKTLSEKVKAFGRRFMTVQSDMGKKNEVDNMVQKVMKEFGKIDILVNNAARPLIRKPLYEIAESEWDNEINTNLKGYHLCSQAVARTMIERKEGTIISIASQAGLKVATVRGAYSISKAGVIMMTKMLAVELGQYNIRVNAVAPGLIRTLRSKPTWGDPEQLKKILPTIPLNRLGETVDIAKAVLFLASDLASYVTGDTLLVEGGVMA